MTTQPRQTSSAADSSLNMSSLFMDFRLLLILFIGFRLMLGMVFQPLLLESSGERGMTVGGDLFYYYSLAQFTDDGNYPFREWWSEFPPVWSWLNALTYQALGAGANFTSWTIAMAFVMLACDVGNLWLMRAIGTRLHGASTGMALAWVYALLLVPVVFAWWNFEVMVTFTLLLSLWWLLTGKETRSALMAGFGALIKFTPALILGAVFRFRPLQNAVRYAVIVVGVFLSVYAVLYITSPDNQMVTVSLTAQFNKASYQSVWALLDGNLGTGNFAAPGVDMVGVHYDANGATQMYGNPAVIPGWLRLIAAGLIGLFVFVRTRRFDDKGLVAFVGITLLIFFLQAQGWSPQWLTQILPLILLTFPNRNGVLICVLLSGLIFAEYPFLFIRTGDTETPGIISGALLTPYITLVLLRTLLLVAVAVAFYRKLRQEAV
jgi:hypothetical protein